MMLHLGCFISRPSWTAQSFRRKVLTGRRGRERSDLVGGGEGVGVGILVKTRDLLLGQPQPGEEGQGQSPTSPAPGHYHLKELISPFRLLIEQSDLRVYLVRIAFPPSV